MRRTPSELLSICIRRGVPVGVVAVALGLGGCTTFTGADPRRSLLVPAAAPAQGEWPARKTSELDAVVARTPKEITELVPETPEPEPAAAAGSDQSGRSADLKKTAGTAAAAATGRAGTAPVTLSLRRAPTRVAYTGRHGQGIIRVLERGDRDSPRRWIRFVSYSTLEHPLTDTRLERRAQMSRKWWEQYLQSRGVTGLRLNDPDILKMTYEGTGIGIEPPTPGTTPRGTIVHMAGLGSYAYELPIIQELKDRGWWVLRVSTPRVWWFEARRFMIPSRDRVPEVARSLAKEIDDLLAESAYAAEGAIDYLARQRPEIPLSPMVMVGCSAGALATPAVVARMPEKFDAVVLVGGGANLLEISQRSDLTTAGISLAWPENQPRPDWRNRLFAEYLKFSKLDPYATAPVIRDKPVLMVHANLDSTVPADNGWLLWDRLGRPDRYVHVVGHRTLFLTLYTQSRRIADWIDAQSPRASGAAASPLR